MKWNVKELKDFIKDLDNETEVVIESIISGDENYCSDTQDIYSSVDDNSGNKLLVLVPKEISINNIAEDDEINEIADYLIENASEAFEHKDRDSLVQALRQYGKWI